MIPMAIPLFIKKFEIPPVNRPENPTFANSLKEKS